MEEVASKNTCSFLRCLMQCAAKKLQMIEYITPLVNVLIRFQMADIFWKSGLTKIHNWSGTLALFANDYKVPFLPPELAAYAGTAVELGTPILLVLGLGTRFAAFALLCMTGVIYYVYPGYMEYIYWSLLLLVLIGYGPGKLSIDHYIRRKYLNIYLG